MTERLSSLLRDELGRRERELREREAQVRQLHAALTVLGIAPVGAPAGKDNLGRLFEASACTCEREREELDALKCYAATLERARAPSAAPHTTLELEAAHVDSRYTERRADALGRRFVAFAVRVRAPAGEWLVYRRYREFEALNAALMRSGLAPAGAALPTKAVLQPRSAHIVEARAAQLSDYLGALVAQRCTRLAGAGLAPSAARALRAFFWPGGEHISDHEAEAVRGGGTVRRLLGLARAAGEGGDDDDEDELNDSNGADGEAPVRSSASWHSQHSLGSAGGSGRAPAGLSTGERDGGRDPSPGLATLVHSLPSDSAASR